MGIFQKNKSHSKIPQKIPMAPASPPRSSPSRSPGRTPPTHRPGAAPGQATYVGRAGEKGGKSMGKAWEAHGKPLKRGQEWRENFLEMTEKNPLKWLKMSEFTLHFGRTRAVQWTSTAILIDYIFMDRFWSSNPATHTKTNRTDVTVRFKVEQVTASYCKQTSSLNSNMSFRFMGYWKRRNQSCRKNVWACLNSNPKQKS